MGGGSPQRRGPTGWGAGGPAQAVAAAYLAPTGDHSAHSGGATGRGGGESCPCDGPHLRSVHSGWQPLAVRAHGPGGRGVSPGRWCPPTELLWGMAAPHGAGPRTTRMGSLAKAVVAV